MPAFAFPADAGTHLLTPQGWKAELALGGWLITYQPAITRFIHFQNIKLSIILDGTKTSALTLLVAILVVDSPHQQASWYLTTNCLSARLCQKSAFGLVVISTFDLLTSKSNQFILAPNRIKVVNLIKFPPVVNIM